MHFPELGARQEYLDTLFDYQHTHQHQLLTAQPNFDGYL